MVKYGILRWCLKQMSDSEVLIARSMWFQICIVHRRHDDRIRLVLLLLDMYRLLDPSVHSVAFSVDDLGLIDEQTRGLTSSPTSTTSCSPRN